MNNYINLLPVYGRGAMINIIEAPRGVGKTFTSTAWLVKRFLKTGHKFIWVRRTEEELQTAKQSFFSKKKLLKKVGLTPDDVKIKGNYGYIKMGRKWVDCVEFCSLSTAAKQRSNDNEDYDVMVVDEAFATPDKVAAFRGNEVSAFIDLFFSKKRDHKLTAFLFGNKEIINNPYYQYFGITPPPHGFSGVRMFRANTLLVWTMSEFVKGEDHNKVAALLSGTPYYDYMFRGAAKTQTAERFGDKPKRARFWASFDFGTPFSVWRTNGTFYVRAGVDRSRLIFICRETRGRYDREMVVTKADKLRFMALDTAARRNKIVYSDPLMAETAGAVFERLGIFR